MGGLFLEHPNFMPADAFKTPEHIAPVWYFTPFYSVLRAVPDKLGGVIAMGAAIFLLFLLPWLDRCQVRSIRYRGVLYKSALTLFVVSFLGLGYLGTQPVTPEATLFARLFSLIYFAFFLLMPLYTRWDKTLPEPERLTLSPPLRQRQEWHWRMLIRCVDGILASDAAQRARAYGEQFLYRLKKNLSLP
jgi:ubiquinol-cytochrome c reductase cytochrome b subunit